MPNRRPSRSDRLRPPSRSAGESRSHRAERRRPSHDPDAGAAGPRQPRSHPALGPVCARRRTTALRRRHRLRRRLHRPRRGQEQEHLLDRRKGHAARRALHNGHHGAVVWLTGLSGSGKSTIAHALEARAVQPRHAHLRARRRQHPPRPEFQPRLLARGPRRKHPSRRRSREADGRCRRDRDHRIHFALPRGSAPRPRDRARREAPNSSKSSSMRRSRSASSATRRTSTKKRARARSRSSPGSMRPTNRPEDAEIVVRTDEQSIEESVGGVLEQLLPRLRTDE